MRRVALVAVVALVALGATGFADAGTVVKTALNTTFNATILVDGRGMTLYLFAEDIRNKSSCDNDPVFHCAKLYPPLTSVGAPHAGAGVKASLLGTTKRPDGRTQVTYAGHPLYTFHGGFGRAADRVPGDANGQGWNSAWWVVSAAGTAIKKH